MVKAIWQGVVIAQSDQTKIVDGNHYFPSDAIVGEHFEKSDHETVCGWKGTASYYDVVVGEQRNTQAAWYYADPKEAASEIRDHVAFWKGVKVES